MAQNAEDNNSSEVSLPKTKPVLHPKYSLKNLNAEQVVSLVLDFKPGSAQSGNVLASAFGPLADVIIDRLLETDGDLPIQLKELAQIWDEFCIEEIYSVFDKLVDQEGDKIRDEILHFPLFARRRVAELLRVKSPKMFYRLVAVRPYSFYTVSQLWDPNDDVTNAVRDYYSALARVYLDYYKAEVSAKSYFAFINVVKSPYKDLYDISNDFEADYESKKFRAIFLKQLAAARTGAALKLRNEQLEGLAQRSFYMPAPLTIETISSLTLRWLSEQSLVFKNDLPAVLLEFILEQDKSTYKKLVADLGRTLTNGILKGIEIGLDSEFPEFNQANMSYDELFRQHSGQVNLNLFASPIHRELFANTLNLVERELEDKIRDRKRAEQSISYLQGRRFYRPWELKTLNQEIRALQRDVYQFNLELKIQNRKVDFLRHVLQEAANVYPSDPLPLLLQISDRVCKEIKITQKLDDPLLYSEVFSFANKKKKAEEIQAEMEKLGYVETKLSYINDRELVDYLHIWQEILVGKSLKSLRKEYTDFRVNRVLVEYEHKLNKKTYDKIQALEPKLAAVISLVKGREKLDHVLLELAGVVISCVDTITNEYLEVNHAKDDLEEFQVYSECAAIIWDWLTLQVENPYQGLKAQKFQPWFEKELCMTIRDLDYDCYIALSYMRPASVLGLEPGADFNWKDVEPFQEHVTLLVDKFVSVASEISREEILFLFTRFKDGLASPFASFLNTKRYDLDLATDKILLLDASQKHLFTSQYRRDALSYWVKFHEEAFFGIHPFHGLFFELLMKELKNKHQDLHLIICLELLEQERHKVSLQREMAFSEYHEILSREINGDVDSRDKNIEEENADELLSLINLSTDKIGFLEGLRRSLS